MSNDFLLGGRGPVQTNNIERTLLQYTFSAILETKEKMLSFCSIQITQPVESVIKSQVRWQPSLRAPSSDTSTKREGTTSNAKRLSEAFPYLAHRWILSENCSLINTMAQAAGSWFVQFWNVLHKVIHRRSLVCQLYPAK